MTSDRELRERALDVRRSFIVQAPAGSGKTELLIQRYLALLARVEVPEQVVALTFTRKAAAEMRRRVLAALAEGEAGRCPQQEHRRRTFELAKAVVEQDRARDWAIAMQPGRLRIETLDALNARLAQHLSVLAGGIGDADVLERPATSYLRAVRRTLAALGSDEPLSADVERVLLAVDGSVGRLEDLLASLLPTRDQWLPHLTKRAVNDLRAHLERALVRLVTEEIEGAARVLPEDFLSRAAALLTPLAEGLGEPELGPCSTVVGMLSVDAWRAMPAMFLTQTNTWRKQLSTRSGFAAGDGELKARCLELIEEYRDADHVRSAIARLRDLPSPHYADEEWLLLQSLRNILLRLVAELKLVFAEQNATDFIDLAVAAQDALGAVDAPSDLLLALDHRVQHLLVDEFQDTSHSQLHLLRLLTAGWERDDGRTLFLVGDPMQSIYRFRHADMSLFLEIYANGFESIEIEPIALVANFRSAPTVIDWVNHTFAKIFPERDDIGAGMAGFRSCQATRQRDSAHAVRWHVLTDDHSRAEVERVTAIVSDEVRRDPSQSIAVLVRSRRHLHGLQSSLRAAGVSARAVELEPPRREQIVQDLITLTRALTHLADRVAWLGLLRAPWCGLTWSDLSVIAAAPVEQAIWTTITTDAAIATLSTDGRARVQGLREILAMRFEVRSSLPFEQWIEETWRAIGGPACLDTLEEAQSAERFFDALVNVADRGDVDDPVALADWFSEPYGQGDAPTGAGIEIMTIHRAKGLEFDTVVLLGLGRRPKSDDTRALYWLERTADDGSEDLLLAPLRTAKDGSDAIATVIRKADMDRDRAERARLLYVATTRARNRLHLVAAVKPDSGRAVAGSFLEFVWDAVVEQMALDAPQDRHEVPEPRAALVPLRRLKEVAVVHYEAEPLAAPAARPEFAWARHAAVQVGTLVHTVLQELADNGLDGYTVDSLEEQRQRFRRELRLRGVDDADLTRAVERVVGAVRAVMADQTGRWLLSGHRDAASELPLTIRGARALEHLRIDRTFVDTDGRRWIVDFKTGVHEGGDVDEFLDSEVERYRPQLARYATALAAIEQRPIWVGLYFPLLQAFRSWQPDISSAERAVD